MALIVEIKAERHVRDISGGQFTGLRWINIALGGGVCERKESKIGKAWMFPRRTVPAAVTGVGGGHALSRDVNVAHQIRREQSVGHPDKNIYEALETEAQILLGSGS